MPTINVEFNASVYEENTSKFSDKSLVRFPNMHSTFSTLKKKKELEKKVFNLFSKTAGYSKIVLFPKPCGTLYELSKMVLANVIAFSILQV